MTRVNDLRIVKLYRVHSFDRNELGYICGTNKAKAAPFYVLVKKYGNSYRIVPTEKFSTDEYVYEDSIVQHSLVLRKERRNNRYVNPVEICPELNGKELTKEQLIEFATKIETIGSYLPTNIVSSRIKEVCNDVENEFENGNGFTF